MSDNTMGRRGRVSDTLRSHPVPLAVLGIGVGWLAVSAARDSMRLNDHGARPRIAGAIRDAGKSAGALVGRMRRTTAARTGIAETRGSPAPHPTEDAGHAHAGHKPDETLAHASDSGIPGGKLRIAARRMQGAGSATWKRARDYAALTGARIHDARDGASEILDDYPLLVGLLGILTGAAIALALAGRGWKHA